MKAQTLRDYLAVHTWVGIVSGLLLFIAFYAGAFSMLEPEITRWTQPAGARDISNDADAAVKRFFETHPKAQGNLSVQLPNEHGQPLLLRYSQRDRHEWLELGQDGQLRKPGLAAEDDQSGNFVDYLHRKAGLPIPLDWAEPVIGVVSLLYALALISGVVVLLPSLVKDLFYLRLGANIKRKWLDVHNLLGVTSLPFHIVIAASAAVFGLHDLIYLAQDKIVYRDGLRQTAARDMPPRPSVQAPPAEWLPPSAVVARVREQAPGFEPNGLRYAGLGTPRGMVLVAGDDPRHFKRGARDGFAMVDPVDGRIFDSSYMPARAEGALATGVVTLFSLHFGSFAGDVGRVLYVLLGLSGALLFYTGNLLWIESRRRKLRGAQTIAQTRASRILGCLTVGIALGSVAGISATVAAAKWLPARVDDLEAWHQAIYYAVFSAAVGWAFARGAGRGAVDLLRLCALLTLAIPLSSLAGGFGLGGSWSHPGTWPVDATALAAVPVFLCIAHRTRVRMQRGHSDSVWASARPLSAG